jgi:four helix bundle suffix protein
MDNSYNHYKNYNDYKGYKSLPFFGQAEIIHDFTVEFTQKYIDYKSRTRDQMDQAGRSGKQNIAEGYLQRSVEGKLKLLGVARGSLEELLNDYLDYLRQHLLAIWDKNDPRSLAIRKIAYNRYKNYNDYKIYLRTPEEAANTMVILINQTNQLLDQKLRWLEEQFVKEGGFRENLLKKRLEYRKKQQL